jgi:prepilin-type N-terminal cleavage/methylation domain-containing protein
VPIHPSDDRQADLMFVRFSRWLRPADRADSVSDTADAGLTLVEVMVAMIVFALIATAGTAMLVTGVSTTRLEKNKTIATGVAATALENLRSYASKPAAFDPTLPSQNILPPHGNTVTTQTVGTEIFTITQTTQWVPKSAPAGSCDATGQGGNSAVQPVLEATESVTWPAQSAITKPVTTTTTFTPPIADQTSGTGGIDLKVTDQTGTGVVGIPIAITGPTTANIVSDSRGCAFAAYLTPGTYTATLSSPGYIDNLENAISTVTYSVTSGTITTGTPLYARSSTITPSFAPSPVPATGLPITVFNSGLSGTGTFGPITSTTPLYPYSTYNIWAGECPEANPNALTSTGTPLYTSGTPTTVTMVAGQATAATVPLYPLTVNVVNSNGHNVSNVTISAKEQATSGAKYPCTLSASYGLVGTTSAGSTVTGMPLGSFTVTAIGYVSGSATTKTAVVQVTPSGATATVTF